MWALLAISGPIYLAILLGYATTRWGLFAKSDLRVLGKFVINLAMPALLFNALAPRRLDEILNGRYLLVYAGGSLLTLLLGWWWGRRVARQTPTATSFYVMGMCCSNSGFVGFPILLLVLPPIAGVVLALNMLVENLVFIPLVLVLAEHGRSGGGTASQVLRGIGYRLLRNPMIWGLVAGLAASLCHLDMPAFMARTVNLFSQASAGLSLFVVGGTLVGLPLSGMGTKIASIAAGKLLLHPLSVLFCITLLPALGLGHLPVDLTAAALLMAAMPMLGIYAILAQPYGQEEVSAAALLVTTATSFVTLNGVLWLLKAFALVA